MSKEHIISIVGPNQCAISKLFYSDGLTVTLDKVFPVDKFGEESYQLTVIGSSVAILAIADQYPNEVYVWEY